MPPARFEPTISADERPQTYALDRTATGTGILTVRMSNKEISALMNPATSVLIKPKSCSALLHLLLLCARGCLKAALRYEFLIWTPVILTQYIDVNKEVRLYLQSTNDSVAHAHCMLGD